MLMANSALEYGGTLRGTGRLVEYTIVRSSINKLVKSFCYCNGRALSNMPQDGAR